jgi:hypothetical protein
MEEPSVLDYVKSKLLPWKNAPVAIPEGDALIVESGETAPEDTPAEKLGVPWLILFALVLAIAAQRMLEPRPQPSLWVGVGLYFLAAAAFLRVLRIHPRLVEPVPPEVEAEAVTAVRAWPFGVSVFLLLVAFILFGSIPFLPPSAANMDNRFNLANTLFWLTGLACLLFSLWIQPPGPSFYRRGRAFLRQRVWNISISRWAMLLVLVFGIVIFFRFYHLNATPGEMFSDQAEKLWDVQDLLSGQTKIFFERNTGREAFQFYLTAFIARIFGTDISFLSLKLGTALAGFFALPFVYLLGKEIGSRWVGLFGLFLAGVAYWPNVISRIGLRFPLYPLFAAPALYFVVRGLRRSNRNDFLWAGLAVGLGLHGYSPFRFVPFVIVAAVILYLLHKHTRMQRSSAVWGLVLLGIVSFAVFLPLARYLLTNPEMVAYRALSRLGDSERALPGAPGVIFLQNLWAAMTMFFWNNGNIWVHSVPNRPALDIISAALFFLGSILVVVRYIRYRDWVDLFLLLSVPLLMMPSILSLAFPEENPSLNRTGGAIVPVFLIAAIGLDGILRGVAARMGRRRGKLAAGLLGVVLLLSSAAQNYNLVFVQFHENFLRGAWNTSQIGHVIRGFADSVGDVDSAYVIPYPYWVDTRLVGINAGVPTKDYALNVDQIVETAPNPRTKLFIFNPQDTAAMDTLVNLYPQGTLSRYTSPLEGKDFLVYLVPGVMTNQP